MICNVLKLYLENAKLCRDLGKRKVTLLMSPLQFEVSGDASVYSVERSVLMPFLHVQLVR